MGWERSSAKSPGRLRTRRLAGFKVAKVLFWSFVAGFSEKFVANIISQKRRTTGLSGLGARDPAHAINQL
jgi:hypothetical protein